MAIFPHRPEAEEKNHPGHDPSLRRDQDRFVPVTGQVLFNQESGELSVEPPIDPTARTPKRPLIREKSGDKEIALLNINPFFGENDIHILSDER
jgi:hypothetical protein